MSRHFAGVALLALSLAAAARPAPVLLTLDTELDPDADSIGALALDMPATYFFTTSYALRHPFLVWRLARNNTIGSHGWNHVDPATLDAATLSGQFRRTALAHRILTGSAPAWYRTPYLATNPAVQQLALDAGIHYDSSVPERWRQPGPQFQLPVSMAEGTDVLVADVKLFEDLKMAEPAALAWLRARYDERESSGRPLVILLHPRIIAAHAQVLHDFITYVRVRGGRFLTADQYRETATHICDRIAVRVEADTDFSIGTELTQAGITDVVVPESSGRLAETLAAFQRQGFRVHIGLSVNRDAQMVRKHPEWAMRDSAGGWSREWLSPEQPGFLHERFVMASQLAAQHLLDGVQLEDLRYPGISFDFSAGAIAAVAAATGVPQPTRALLAGGPGYAAWVAWRKGALVRELAAIRAELGRTAPQLALSAAVPGDLARSFLVEDESGQDLARLAPLLDFISPIPTANVPLAQFSWAARYLAGEVPVVPLLKVSEGWRGNTNCSSVADAQQKAR